MNMFYISIFWYFDFWTFLLFKSVYNSNKTYTHTKGHKFIHSPFYDVFKSIKIRNAKVIYEIGTQMQPFIQWATS